MTRCNKSGGYLDISVIRRIGIPLETNNYTYYRLSGFRSQYNLLPYEARSSLLIIMSP